MSKKHIAKSKVRRTVDPSAKRDTNLRNNRKTRRDVKALEAVDVETDGRLDRLEDAMGEVYIVVQQILLAVTEGAAATRRRGR